MDVLKIISWLLRHVRTVWNDRWLCWNNTHCSRCFWDDFEWEQRDKSTPKVNNCWGLKVELSGATLPREKMHRDTWGIFRASNRSGVWKTSSSGTPYFFAALRKDWRNKIKNEISSNVWLFPYLDILHQQESGALQRSNYVWNIFTLWSNLFFELLDTVRLDLVHETTQNNAVLENLSKVALRQLLIQDSFDPLECVVSLI